MVADGMPGGLSEEQQPDHDIDDLVKSVRPSVESSTGVEYDAFSPVAYRTQVSSCDGFEAMNTV